MVLANPIYIIEYGLSISLYLYVLVGMVLIIFALYNAQ
jgi:hypothetical protein